MSPTYWTASQLKAAAIRHGWLFIGATEPQGWWGMRREGSSPDCGCCAHRYSPALRIMVQEDRRGGLMRASLTRIRDGGSDTVQLGPRTAHKREAVLSWLTEPIDWTQWGFRP
jgi:hypothetical protein